MRYANIIIDISHEAVDRPFTYIIPDRFEEMCHPGTKVKVPFGKGNSVRVGYILDISDNPDVPVYRLKEIEDIVLSQNATESKLIELAFFMKERYGSTMINALKTVLPVKKAYRGKKKQLPADDSVSSATVELNEAQQSIVDEFASDYDTGVRKTYLIHGITGSGKTEVYINMIRHVVSKGQSCIVLIPEIGLTYQTVMRFRKYFGDRVAIMNSMLSAGTRYEHCCRAKNGEIDVIIGPRSALFTPFANIGLIVIDEEHESTYKSENVPRYHAKEVALKLASMHGASVVLGSATPSVDSYYKAMQSDYRLFTMDKRAGMGELPSVDIVDLRNELAEGNRSIFSRRLMELMKDRLDKKEQIMLFINRRGYAGFVSCRACGEAVKCPHCDVSLSEHRSEGKLVCHYCGYEIVKPKLCPVCGSKYISSFRAGTEQIEDEVRKMYPGVRTLRMDADTTRQKGNYEKILSSFGNHEADVLIGTQMIVKGHDYPLVTLVGVIAADIGLAAGDYAAGERTFDLLTQAAGRSGRGDRPGNVVIQTYQPNHYSVVHAANQDYKSFYEEEITYREISMYPPVCNILAVMASGKEMNATLSLISEMATIVRQYNSKLNVIGPGSAGIGKINDYYRYVFYIKNKDMSVLIKIKDMLEKYLTNAKSEISVWFDVNPINPF